MVDKAFCISFWYRGQVRTVETITKDVMYDNGAFTAYTKGKDIDWKTYYSWLEPRLFEDRRWAVIPDVIDAGSQLQDALLKDWPLGKERGAPVWHTDEPIDRVLRLLDEWPRVCFGSTGEHWNIQSQVWRDRLSEVWDEILKRHKEPNVHMLRGMQVLHDYPFTSADSTTFGQNSHNYDNPTLPHEDLNRYNGRKLYLERVESGDVSWGFLRRVQKYYEETEDTKLTPRNGRLVLPTA